MRFYTTERVGEKRRKTPEGFLVIQDAVLARTGKQIYGPGETPIESGDSNVAIDRDAEDVFDPAAIASANGKAFTDEHPQEDVTPANWHTYAKGHVLNPHRGTEDQHDVLLGDIVVTAPELIAELESEGGRRELSCGYDAEYEETGPGQGRQRNIRINHVALVDEGRCGPRCSIGDRAPRQRRRPMAVIKDYLRRAFRAKDEKELDTISREAEAELPEGLVDRRHRDEETHIHLHTGGEGGPRMERDAENPNGGSPEDTPAWFKRYTEQNDRRMGDMEGSVAKLLEKFFAEEAQEQSHQDRRSRDEDETEEERRRREEESRDRRRSRDDEEEEERAEEEAPEHEKDRARRSKDSAFLAETWQDAVSLAEIIAPGITLPVFDGKAPRRRGLDALCNLRKRALDAAYTTEEGRSLIVGYLGGRRSYDSLKPCSMEAKALFHHVGSVKRQRNADLMASGRHPSQDRAVVAAGGGVLSLTSPAAMNARAAEIYGYGNR